MNHVCVSPAAVIGCVLSVTFDLCERVADVTAWHEGDAGELEAHSWCCFWVFFTCVVVLGSGCNDWQFMQKINWRTGGWPTRKHRNTHLVFYMISCHPSLSLWPPAAFQWYHRPPPTSSPSLLLFSPMYILSTQTPTLETASIIELLPSALLCNCHPTSALTFGGFVSKGGREGVHICTHTQKWHLSWLGIAEQLLWYLGQRDKCQSSSNLAFHILEKKNRTVSVCFYMHALKYKADI